jgi:hypothetical protein
LGVGDLADIFLVSKWAMELRVKESGQDIYDHFKISFDERRLKVRFDAHK